MAEGLAGQFDPCYTSPATPTASASTPDNINDTALDINSDAVAHSVLTFAMTTSSAERHGQGEHQRHQDGLRVEGRPPPPLADQAPVERLEQALDRALDRLVGAVQAHVGPVGLL